MQVRIGKRFFLATAVFVWLTCMVLPMKAEEKTAFGDTGIAAVNGAVISQKDLDIQVNNIQQQYAARGQALSEPELSAIRDQVLEGLISQELIYQESQKEETKIEEEIVNKELEGMKSRFPSEVEFKNALTQMGLTEATLRLQIERGLAIQHFIDNQVAQGITVSEEEVKAYYDKHPDAFKKPEEVQASHILIKVDPEAEEPQKTAALKEIESIQDKVQKGEDFGALAREFSQGPSNVKGGDLGYFKRGQMVKPFEDVAFALAPGEVAPIVETRFGYHLIKVTGKRPETIVAYDTVKDNLKKFLKEQKVKGQVNTYIEEIKGKAKIERF